MAGDPVNERFFPYGFIAVAAVRCERMALEVMIYRSVKTEAGDGDKPPDLAGRPGFSAEREVPIAAVCRPLSAHDENGMLRRLLIAGLGQAVWVTDLRVPFSGIMPRSKAATIIRMLRPNMMR